MYKYLLKTVFNSLGIYPEEELLDHVAVLFLIFGRLNHFDFHSGCTILHSFMGRWKYFIPILSTKYSFGYFI